MGRIPLSIPYLNGNEWKYIKECLDTNWVSSVGKYVEEFEAKLSDYVGVDHGVAMTNGTAAIHTALKIIEVEEGDKVLVPSLTFIASVNPIRYCGAEPVFIDSEERTYNIDPKKTVTKIKEMINNGDKPKAVIVVHLYGHPVNIGPILKVCNDYDIKVIEDATEALGSKYKDKMVGALGDIGCFSFNGNKLITTGGGGMLVTDNKEYAEYAKYLSTQAKDDAKNYIHNEVGYNYRLNNIQAAMGVAQLEQINDFIVRKRGIAKEYTSTLKKIDGIKVNEEEKWAYNNYWLYSILIDENKFGITSKELYKQLNEIGVMARPFFKPIHTMPMYQDCEAKIDIANILWKQGINLPCSVNIKPEEVKIVIDSIVNLKR
ncbi:LegC family aminotransferase [Selenihalanaerobacter shriftii]|uniref:Perosamine synthetase n=1 Tax=Selenihalanaerobacter shriftii TaxID=142842 RepID=A0A1T4KMA6_9FIRM|nr:LegC family aminotransferase [Selenihalanaerobacter shriftii]SJZ43518.1 perosamine synthetase [Selenihalanaerobacter shriftii]